MRHYLVLATGLFFFHLAAFAEEVSPDSVIDASLLSPAEEAVIPRLSDQVAFLASDSSGSGLRVAPVVLNRSWVASSDSKTGRPNKIAYELKACLQDESGNGLRSIPVKLESFTNGEQGLKTDASEACVFWRETIAFDYFGTQKDLKKSVRITAEGSSKTLVLFFNPWQYQNFGLSFKDARETSGSIVKAGASNPEILLSDAIFSFVGREFDVDNNLSLSVIRKYRISMSPKIQRNTLQGLQTEALGRGTVKLVLMLQGQSYTPKSLNESFIDAQTINVESNGDTLTADISIRFNDLREILSRTKLRIAIIPNVPGFKSKLFSGSFEPVNPGMHVSLTEEAGDLEKMIAGVRAAVPPVASVDSLSEFRRAYRMNMITSKGYQDFGFTSKDQDRFVAKPSAGKDVRAKLCKYFFGDYEFSMGVNVAVLPLYSLQAQCRSNPEFFLSAKAVEFVKNVNARPVIQRVDNVNMSLAAGFSFRESTSRDHSSGSRQSVGVNAKAGAGLETPFGEIGVGVSAGKDWYVSDSVSHSIGTGHDANVHIGKTINAEDIEFGFDVNSTRCLIISRSLSEALPARQIIPLQLCESEPKRRLRSEIYHYIYLYFRNAASPIQDSAADPIERPWTILIRGQERFDSFTKLMRDSTQTIFFSEATPIPDHILKRTMGAYDGLFPGMIVPQN